MNIIKEAYDRARSVFGQVLGVVGEARVGEARRLLELRNTLSKEKITYLEGASARSMEAPWSTCSY